MKKYYAEIFESYYEDNFENGQVGPFNRIKLESKSFESLSEAIDYLKKNYGETYPLEIDEGIDHIICPVSMRKAHDYYGFEKATEDEHKQWEAGKINLYNVEYLMAIYRIEKVPIDEIEKVI